MNSLFHAILEFDIPQGECSGAIDANLELWTFHNNASRILTHVKQKGDKNKEN